MIASSQTGSRPDQTHIKNARFRLETSLWDGQIFAALPIFTTMETLRLHYAPDNASGIIRLALEERGLSYDAVLVDRASKAQQSAAYRAINPAGLIPALETPKGTIFETAAILLWLADTYGKLGPAPDDADRPQFLSWLFYLSNTTHADLRLNFYPDQYIGPSTTDHATLRKGARARLIRSLDLLEDLALQNKPWFNGQNPSALDLYVCMMLRWMALYPQGDTDWFSLPNWPTLQSLAARLESRPSVLALCKAEGMAPNPFTTPKSPNPPEGVAL
ncbi:glutathione S-transferase family protein [Shimia sp. CNT1-13L.2]|uniref:glutathione S-transferase family protein n=1 Tax=Shimia sp. CNT1-13L.2 TaxID=2959663 RepID=UPI0034E986B0